MRIWLLLFLSIVFKVAAASLDSVPLLYEGRFRPAASTPSLWEEAFAEREPLESRWRCLPSRRFGEWLPLCALLKSEENPTLYPEPLFHQLRECYFALREEPSSAPLRKELERLLWEGYRPLERTPYLYAYGKQRLYPSRFQLELELLLERLPLTLSLAISYLLGWILGPLLFIAPFALHTLWLVARIAITERPPVSNMAETLLYVPWVVAGLSLLLSRYRRVLICGGLAAGGLLLLFWLSHLGEGIENLQPVVDSNRWLGAHVLLVSGSYGALLLASILGHSYLIKPSLRTPRRILQTLYIGTGMLIAGTLLGAVWAAESWGRFWDWDPKESWAFISICSYLLIIHARQFRLLSDLWLALSAALAFFAITFTWYGVNYLLKTGLHSYGFGQGGGGLYLAAVAADALFLTFLALRRKKTIVQ